MNLKNYKPPVNKRKLLVWVLAGMVALVGIIGGVYAGYKVYSSRMQLRDKALNNDTTLRTFVVTSGETSKQISAHLQAQNFIKSSKAFDKIVSAKDVNEALQAGTYQLSSSMLPSQIVSILTNGKVSSGLFTILPAQRLNQIRTAFLKSGYSEAEVDAGLDIKQYADHKVFKTGLPANLEGYLYPESFQKSDTTKVSTLVRQSLDELAKRLTDERVSSWQKEGLSVQQAITLASIVEKEVSNTADRRQVAQVFLLRLQKKMVLGSDVTYIYAASITGKPATPDLDSPYNTRKYGGLPPGPISNVSESSLDAVAHPADGDYLYFVAGDDGKTYFSHTEAEHERLAAEHCIKLCSSVQ